MKQKYIVYVYSFFYTWSLAAHTVIILVHGTWGQEGSWYQPQGDFHSALALDHIVSFTWIAHNKHEAREKAARNLAQLIMSYPKNTELILIGHSHGGNVVNIATSFLPDRSPYWIKAVFSLATPVSNVSYYPNMNAIHYYYHLFSLSDAIQPVFGLFERTYNHHERLFNCRVIINDNEPDHHELHHSCIGAALINMYHHLPLHDTHELLITFYDNQNPIITTDKKQRDLIAANTQAVHHAVEGCFRKNNPIPYLRTSP